MTLSLTVTSQQWLKKKVCLVIHIARCLVVSVCFCFSLFGPELCGVTFGRCLVIICDPSLGCRYGNTALLGSNACTPHPQERASESKKMPRSVFELHHRSPYSLVVRISENLTVTWRRIKLSFMSLVDLQIESAQYQGLSRRSPRRTTYASVVLVKCLSCTHLSTASKMDTVTLP